mgnify:CR=1 FL=1|tara:strand:- start:477 stop:1826 length:1350 start_codon:yes stop_codon:yes gene_type:complete
MRWTTTLITVCMATALVVVAWLMHESAPTRARASDPVPLATPAELPRDEIDRIEVRFGTDHPLVFGRDAEGWWQIEPFRHAASYPAMLSLIEAPLTTRVVDRIDAPGEDDLERLSLAPPRATITFGTGERRVRFDIGQTGLGGRAYVRRDGGPEVLVVDDALPSTLLDANPVLWRDRTLFPGVDIEADRIERSVGDNEVVMERSGRDWAIVDPIATRIDAESMGTHAIDLARAMWTQVLLDEPDDLSSFGLDPPLARLAVTRDDRTRVLLIGDRVGGATQDRAAMVEGIPVVLQLDGRTVASLLPDPVTLVDHRASRLRGADVKSIEIDAGDGVFRLERSLDRWIAPGFDGQDVPVDRVEELLQSITSLRATEVEIRDGYPSELERARITLFGFDGAPLDTVRLLREEPDSGRWAMENGDNVLRVHPEFLVLHLSPVDYGLSTGGEDTP